MKRLIVAILSLIIVTASCKKSKDSNTEANVKESPNIFSFRMSGVFEKDEKLTLFYLTPGTDQISLRNSKQIDIKGSGSLQTVQFDLPEEILPTRILIRFGDKENDKIYMGDIKLMYGEKEINVPRGSFFKFFQPNKNAVYIDSLKTIMSKNIEKGAPMFFSRRTLETKIDLTFP